MTCLALCFQYSVWFFIRFSIFFYWIDLPYILLSSSLHSAVCLYYFSIYWSFVTSNFWIICMGFLPTFIYCVKLLKSCQFGRKPYCLICFIYNVILSWDLYICWDPSLFSFYVKDVLLSTLSLRTQFLLLFRKEETNLGNNMTENIPDGKIQQKPKKNYNTNSNRAKNSAETKA